MFLNVEIIHQHSVVTFRSYFDVKDLILSKTIFYFYSDYINLDEKKYSTHYTFKFYASYANIYFSMMKKQ